MMLWWADCGGAPIDGHESIDGLIAVAGNMFHSGANPNGGKTETHLKCKVYFKLKLFKNE